VTLSGFDGPVEDFALELGYVTGVRGFRTDYLGRLRGITHTEVFNPGVNLAICYAGCDTKDMGNCSCGYYAYFITDRAKMHYATEGDVGAIIRGYGQTVVGTKGFRALKADLVAVFDMNQLPRPDRPRSTSPFRHFYPSYKTFVLWQDNPEAYAKVSTDLPLAWVAVVGAITLLSILFGFWAAAPIFLSCLWLFGFSRRWKASDEAHRAYRWPTLYPGAKGDKLVRLTRDPDEFYGRTAGRRNVYSQESLQKLLSLTYPDVPYYDTMEEALAAHPIDSPGEDSGKRSVMNQPFQMPNVQPQFSAATQAAMIKAAREFKRKYGNP
jgi:hypothetical protein